MTTIDFELAIDNCVSYKQMGNKLVVINGDIATVYDIMEYENYEPKTLIDLNRHFAITKNDTWGIVENRIFGNPIMPDFIKAINL